MRRQPLKVGYVLKVFPRLSETFILNEILELERLGVEVDIFSLHPPSDPRFHRRLAELRAQVTYLPKADSGEIWRELCALSPGRLVEPHRLGAAVLRRMEASDKEALKPLYQGMYVALAAERRGIQHVHAHFATSATQVATVAHELTGIRFSFTAHAKDLYHRDRNPAELREAMAAASFAVTVTDHNLNWIKERHPEHGHKVRRIYNGLPVEEIRMVAPRDGSPRRLVAVGRLVEKKGFPYLIEACRILKERRRPLECRIIGGGDHEAELHELIRAHDLSDSVRLCGPQNHEQVLQAMADSHLTVLPCIVGEDGNRDALPTVLLESMALGRPVVSTHLPGVTEIVDHEETGLLVPQRDAGALADAIDLLVNDRERCQRMGFLGRAKVERMFEIRKNVAQLATLFEESAGVLCGARENRFVGVA